MKAMDEKTRLAIDNGQDDITVFAAHVEVTEHVVGNSPDEVGNPVQVVVAHAVVLISVKVAF